MNVFIGKPGQTPLWKAALNVLLLCSLLVLLFWFALSRIGVVFDFSFVSTHKINLFQGYMMTLGISVFSLVLSLLIGLSTAVLQQSPVLPLRLFAKMYVGFIRGTPLIMQIFLFYYIVGTAVGIENRFVSGVLVLSIFEGAYISEIIRGSLLSFDPTQLEAAKAVGFTSRQCTRYVLLPQLTARTLPALTGQFASIIKDSSLLSMISLIELTQTVNEIGSDNFKIFELNFVLGLLYLTLTVPVTLISKQLERRFSYEN